MRRRAYLGLCTLATLSGCKSLPIDGSETPTDTPGETTTTTSPTGTTTTTVGYGGTATTDTTTTTGVPDVEYGTIGYGDGGYGGTME
ncbi:MAG: hypothetical protein ABEI96_01520 [Haloarculaceae archaeon]